MKRLIHYFVKWQGLILASLFCALVLMARISVTGSLRYSFLLWNLFLAFIPLFVSDYLLKKSFVQKYKVLLGMGVWLLFFPNAPYIITDLMHLTKSYRQIPWLDSVLIFSFAITALTIGLISLMQMRKICMKYYSFKFQSLVWLIVFPLTGFGVYLGRFERWNSWDLLTNPFGLLQNCLENLVNVRAMAITLVFGGCLFITQQLILQASKILYDTDTKMPE